MDDVSGVRRGLRHRWSRRAGLLAIVAGAGVLTAACGGGSSTPQVASLGHSSSGAASSASTGSGGNLAASGSDGNATQLLDEWAACMRIHGDDPGQTDPTVDANKVIHIILAHSLPGGDTGTNGQYGSGGPASHCATYLTEAANALGEGFSPAKTPDQAKLDEFSACVRANGIPDFPDLRASGGGVVMHLNGGDVSLNNPAMKNAEKLCGQKTGVQGLPGEGAPPPGTIIDDGPGGGPGANG
jgi:hypothetical protein